MISSNKKGSKDFATICTLSLSYSVFSYFPSLEAKSQSCYFEEVCRDCPFKLPRIGSLWNVYTSWRGLNEKVLFVKIAHFNSPALGSFEILRKQKCLQQFQQHSMFIRAFVVKIAENLLSVWSLVDVWGITWSTYQLTLLFILKTLLSLPYTDSQVVNWEQNFHRQRNSTWSIIQGHIISA